MGDDGKVKGICILQRELKGGSTYRAERIINESWENTLIKIAEKLKMKYVNIQLKENDGILYPFEFNGRFSGTTGIISRVFNAPEMFIREKVLGEKLTKANNNEKFYMMRYYDEIYSSENNMENLINRSQVYNDPECNL